jgi:hypothetical protein
MMFLQGSEMREQVEALEDHADRAALAGDGLVVELVELVALAVIADALAGDPRARRRRCARAG